MLKESVCPEATLLTKWGGCTTSTVSTRSSFG